MSRRRRRSRMERIAPYVGLVIVVILILALVVPTCLPPPAA